MTTKQTKATTSRSTGASAAVKKAEPSVSNIDTTVFEKDIYKTAPKEYEIIKGGGIFYMMGKSEYTVYDESRGGVVSVRYCESEKSIYKEDQSEFSVVSPIVFENKRLFVPPTKPNLSEFLDKHPGNEINGGSVFRFIDYRKNAKDNIDKEFQVVDALVLIRTKPVDDLLSVATSLGINTDRLIDEIRHDLAVYAKKNPVVFSQMFDDPATKIKSTIKKAVSYGVIANDRGYVRWKDTNNHIIAIPEGKDFIDVMTRYCLTEAGSPVYEEIKRQLS